MNINISYMYLGYRRENATPVILLHSEDLDVVSRTLTQAGYTVY